MFRQEIIEPLKPKDLYEIRDLLTRGYSIEDLQLRVTYYTRVSTDTDQQLHSLKGQISFFEQYIKERKNWNLIEGYVDEGISATSTTKREAFKQMIIDGKEGKFDLIVTKEVSRFARNTQDSIFYTRELLRYDIGVLFKNDGFCTYEKDSELRLTIMSGVAQDESRKISERVRFGFKNSIKNGIVLGNSKIWGYEKDNGKLVIIPEQAKIVKELFELYAEGYGFRAIEKIFKEKGYFNTNGRPFGYSTLNRLLTNPKYKGYYVGGKTTKIDFLSSKIKRFDEKEWVQWKDEDGDIVPAIVSEELWNKCNSILKERSKKMTSEDKTSYQNKYMYSGRIICGQHNISYWHNKYKYKTGEKTIWQCSEYRKGGKQACDNPPIYTHELDFILKEVLTQVTGNIEVLYRSLEVLYKQTIKELDYDKDLKELQSKIRKIDQKKDKLLDLSLEGMITDIEFKKRNDKFNEDIKIYEDQIERMEELNDAKISNEQTMETIKKWLNNKSKTDFTGTSSSKMIKDFLDKIIVYKSKHKDCLRLNIILKTGLQIPVFYARVKSSMAEEDMRLLDITHILSDKRILKLVRRINARTTEIKVELGVYFNFSA